MSQLKDEENDVHIISDSDDSNLLRNGFAGFPSAQKRVPSDAATTELIREPPSARKKLKIDEGERVETVVEIATDIESISTNPRRTRPKVSSDTSSKFPVSSPSDTMPVAGHRKKYVKNTLPAGAFERMLQEVAQSHPLMTFQEKLEKWICSNDLSDVEDVNSFDDQFQKREQQYKRTNSTKRSTTSSINDPPNQKYNYQHFRMVVLEKFKGSPAPVPPSPDGQGKQDRPSCSKELDTAVVVPVDCSKSEQPTVVHYEKVLCPSSESSATKASPSIRLHWTDEDSVFRCNRLNPEIDKFSKLIKMRIDYKKQINLKEKMNEIFKTPTVPPKYNHCACDSPDPEATSEVKPAQEQKLVERKIETRRSTGGKSNDSRRSLEKKNTDRRSSDKFTEVSSFQQDEFCNYLGLGMNGKVYSPTPTDNKRRSLRVRRQQQQIETTPVKRKTTEKKESKKEKGSSTEREKAAEEGKDKTKEKEPEVTTTTAKEMRNSLSSPVTTKILERATSEEPKPTQSQALVTPEIRILDQIRNSSLPATAHHPPSTPTTVNSVSQRTRRIRRTRATSNGTSTCPRSSQSDESPSKTTTRRKRLQHHTRRNNHTSDLSESLLSDPQAHDGSPQHNGRASTVPSSEGRKEEIPSTLQMDALEVPESLHKKIQRYLEESRKTKPSIFIVDSINSVDFKVAEEVPANCTSENNNVFKEDQPQLEEKSSKAKQWPKKKIIHRRLLRRNGAAGGGTTNQRILRSRKLVKPLRIKICKHPMRKKIRAMKKKALQAQLARELDESQKEDEGEKNGNENLEVETLEEQKLDEEKSDSEELPVESSSHVGVEVQIQTETIDVDNCNESQKETNCHHQAVKKPETEEAEAQTEPFSPSPPISVVTPHASRMLNPLKKENGRVVYAYYECDVLTVVQDLVVTFWKITKLIQILSSSTCEWLYLGECRRLLFDEEIKVPYKNRICVSNTPQYSMPIYIEIRAKELSKERRDCNLISVYINVYYYDEDRQVAKSHSIQMDVVATVPQNLAYTAITDSRYFIMCWSQETMLGKPRSGMCKYSLNPNLDSLASIREFKFMRHEIHYLECTNKDYLIGFGDTQVTLWDHRSGDILMNYDLDYEIGSNFGIVYYPPLEIGQDNTMFIFQKTARYELTIIAINVSHNAPSHRFICTHKLPAEFGDFKSSMQTDDHVIFTNEERHELWIDCCDLHYMVQVKTTPDRSRFYAPCKQSVIDITDNYLSLETFSNFVVKMFDPSDK